MVREMVSSVSVTSYDSLVMVIISSSSMNHLICGFGLPPVILRLKVASLPSVAVTFSSLPAFGFSILIILNLLHVLVLIKAYHLINPYLLFKLQF